MINSVVRALRMLEVLDGAGEDGLALGEIARQCGLKAPTAHSILATLVRLDYASHDPATRLYALGTQAAALGRRRHLAGVLASAARPSLEDLGRRLGETVLLAMLRARRRHTLLTVESAHALRVAAPAVLDDQLCETATGRVLLSGLPADELDAVFAELGAPGSRWPEASTEPQLRDQLEAIRRDGYAIVHRSDAHIHAVAVPLTVGGHDGVAALGTYYPAVRGSRTRERDFIAALRATAERIEAQFENQTGVGLARVTDGK